MDSVAFYIDRQNALSLIQALREAKEKCEGDGRRIMAENYANLEGLMRDQYAVAESIRENMDRNGGEYRL